MRHSKEIVILVMLFVIMAAGTLWYVIDRRAKNRATPPAASLPHASEPLVATQPHARPDPTKLPGVVVAKDVDPTLLGGPNERKTIDFSSGTAVVKDTPEDKAALEAGLKDIADATKDVTFEAAKPAEAPKK